MPPSIQQWEDAELTRSRAEASRTDISSLAMSPSNFARYDDPPYNTCYPLEYCFFLLGDLQDKVVLEYGRGDGLNTLLLANRRPKKLIALDISPDLIDLAKRRLKANSMTSEVEFCARRTSS